MKEKLYTIETLRLMANVLIEGNTKVVHLEQIKEIFARYGYTIESVGNKYKLIKK